MAFFQPNVLKKYVNGLKQELLTEKYELYKAYFLNPEIQENIRKSKEEQFQEGFLRELFVKILGYTLNPSPNFNLITEQKNEADSKKADGAIIVDDKIVGVIELKDHKTTDLKSVEAQAFGYKSQNQNAKYVVISNFEKLNFYIDNSVAFQEFDLFHLSLADFATLWICLAFESIKTNLPETVKKESVSNEDSITKSFYRDYSGFKKALFADILQNNRFDTPDEKILIFKKTQKLLDRMLFIFFAEDGGLLQPNTMRMIIDRWEKLRDMDAYTPLYEQIRKYFGYIDTGHEDKQLKVFAYNGGLFKPDDLLDRLIISDDLLAMHTRRLADYDFRSDVDVNILGHIFEHSLSEIEEVTNQLQEGGKVQQTSKRKKDGVFYTPQYITKYIVENTIGKLCAEKKAELGIRDDEYFADRKRQESTKRCLLEKLYAYRDWLKQITICDPACGSGAFLNASLNFLIAEHSLINEMETKIAGGGMVFSYFGNDILERNIYGVDINEESVEIAKLSLWLRTAQPNRKLNSLNNNIKCGNSLISDPEVAGDKAFDWEKEFPEVFAKGGFDVVIGNPPYLRVQGLRENFALETSFYEKNYQSAKGRFDFYILFMEKSLDLIKKNSGVSSFILPHNFTAGNLGAGIRSILSTNHYLEEIIHFGSHFVFDDAQTYTCIIKMSNNNNIIKYVAINPIELKNCSKLEFEILDYDKLGVDSWNLNNKSIQAILNKMKKSNCVEDVFDVGRGVVTGYDDCFILKGSCDGALFKGFSKALNQTIEIEASIVRPLLMGHDVHAYETMKTSTYLLYPHEFVERKTIVISEEKMQSRYPLAFSYLLNFKETLIAKKVKYKTNPSLWWGLHNSRDLNLFCNAKIVTPYLANTCQMSFDSSGSFFTNDKCSILKVKDTYCEYAKSYLAILNSRLCWFFISNTSSEFSGQYFVFSNLFINPFPLPDFSIQKESAEILSNLADTMLNLNKSLQQKRSKFLHRLSTSEGFENIKITSTLEKFDESDFKTFVAELKKQKIKLSLTQQDEWEEYFTTYKNECNDLSKKITATDREIDQKVYELYGLTDEEIAIVEGKD